MGKSLPGRRRIPVAVYFYTVAFCFSWGVWSIPILFPMEESRATLWISLGGAGTLVASALTFLLYYDEKARKDFIYRLVRVGSVPPHLVASALLVPIIIQLLTSDLTRGINDVFREKGIFYPLFGIAGSYQAELGVFSLGFWFFLLNIVPQSIVCGYFYLRSGRSIPMAVLFHYSINLSGEAFDMSEGGHPLYLALYWILALICLTCYRWDQKKIT